MLFPSALYALEEEGGENTESNTSAKNLLGTEIFSSFKAPKHSSGSDSLREKRKKDGEGETSSSSSDHSDRLWEEEKKQKKKRKRRKKYKASSGDSSDGSTQRSRKKEKKKKANKKKTKKKKNDTKHFEPNTTKPDTIWLDETNLDFSQAYRSDTRSDRQNLDYGSLYKMHVAKYMIPINLRCLGLTQSQQIDVYSDLHVKKKKSKKNTSSNLRYFLPSMNKAPEGSKDISERSTADNTEEERFVHSVESELFIPIKTTYSDYNFTEENQVIQNEKNVNRSQQNRQFSQRLLENPHDVKAWLEFVDAQDENCPFSNVDHYRSDAKESWVSSKELCEKKISILEKAILKNPTSLELIIRHMDLIKDVWLPADVINKWKKIIFQFPNRSRLWIEYLNFLQTDLIKMSVTNVMESYRKCFRMLLGVYHKTITSHKPEANALDGIVLVFIHLLLFLWQAGHTEKATTLFQCFFDFNACKRTSDVTTSTHLMQEIVHYEEHFNSDVKRLGEEGYLVWGSSELMNEVFHITHSPATSSTFNNALQKQKDSFGCTEEGKKKMWVHLEAHRCSSMDMFSYRGNPDECEDTERIVLFDDISFALFLLPNQDSFFQVLIVFLIVLGIPVPRSGINHSVYELTLKYIMLVKSSDLYPCFCHNDFSCDYMYAAPNSYFSSCLENSDLIVWARLLLSGALQGFGEKYVREVSQIWFHFECMMFRRAFEDTLHELSKKYWKEMRKFAKSILKLQPNRNCTELWHMYGRYEWYLGNVKDSQNVFSMAIKSFSGPTSNNYGLQIASTVRCMIDLLLDDGERITENNKDILLHIYFAFLDPNTPLNLTQETQKAASPLKLLKISTLLRDERLRILGQSLSQWSMKDVDFICCQVVYAYLFAGFNSLYSVAQEILNYFKEHVEGQNTNKLQYQDIFKYAVVIMKQESYCEHFSKYKMFVQSCVIMLKYDHFLVTSYLQSNNFGLNSLHVRRMFEGKLKNESSLDVWLHYFKFEEQRLKSVALVPSDQQIQDIAMEIVETRTGVHNRIRSLYQRVLREERFRYNSQIWWMFIEFLLSHFGVKNARDVLYTSLRACPASKTLYMLACEKIEMFEEMYEAMTEKEVRVRLLVEELDIIVDWSN